MGLPCEPYGGVPTPTASIGMSSTMEEEKRTKLVAGDTGGHGDEGASSR
jgi:hypothetical protein